MSEYGTVKRENIENIADAIREKLGSEDDYTPSQMASAILQIETGGVDTLNELLNGRLSVVSSDCTLLSNYALSYFNGNQMSGYFPELTAVKTYTFTSSPFVYLNTPKLSSAGNYFARYCPLTSVHMPELRDAGQYAFGGTKFTEINDNMFPKLISCNSYAFNNAATTTQLTAVRLHNLSATSTQSFATNSKLEYVKFDNMRSLATTTFTNCTSTKFTLDISEPSISKKCWLSAQTLNGDGRNMFKGYTSIPATTMSALLVENDTVEQFKYTQPLSPLSAYASKVKKNTAQGNHPWYFKAEYNGNQLTGMIERGNACVCHNDDLGEYGRYFMVFNTNGYAYTYRCVQNYFAYYINRSLSTATAYPEQYVTELSCSDPWYAMRMGEKILTSDLSGVTASEVKQITQNDSYCKFKILKKLTIPDLSATEQYVWNHTTLTDFSAPNLKSVKSTKQTCTLLGQVSELTSFSAPELVEYGQPGNTYGSIISTSKLQTLTLPKLETINAPLIDTSGHPVLTDIYLKSFKNTSSRFIFGNMSNIHIHFGAENEAAIKALPGYSTQFGGTNLTFTFDL